MKKHGWWTLPLLVVAGCVTTSRPPVPDEAMASVSRVKLETLSRGYGVYMSQCTRCHEALMPADISNDEWHVVVPGMAWNASISTEDEQAVLAYIMAAKEVTP